MKKHKKHLVGIVLTLAALMLGSKESLVAQNVISDSFAISESRIAGEFITGQTPEKGSGLWKGRVMFLPTGGVTLPPGVPGATGLIAVPAEAQPIKVQADVVTVNTEWVAMALVKNDAAHDIFAPDKSLLFVALLPTGDWALLGAGGTKTFTRGKISDFNPTATYGLGLAFKPTGEKAGSASVFINGERQGEEVPVTIQDTIGAAGLVFLAPKETKGTTSPSVKNFQVQWTPKSGSGAEK